MAERSNGIDAKPGERVYVLDGTGQTLIGCGVYEGDFQIELSPEELEQHVDALLKDVGNPPGTHTPEEARAEARNILLGHLRTHPNPRMLLDDGRRVWGYQCWWGPEAQLPSHLKPGYSAWGDEDSEQRPDADRIQ